MYDNLFPFMPHWLLSLADAHPLIAQMTVVVIVSGLLQAAKDVFESKNTKSAA